MQSQSVIWISDNENNSENQRTLSQEAPPPFHWWVSPACCSLSPAWSCAPPPPRSQIRGAGDQREYTSASWRRGRASLERWSAAFWKPRQTFLRKCLLSSEKCQTPLFEETVSLLGGRPAWDCCRLSEAWSGLRSAPTKLSNISSHPMTIIQRRYERPFPTGSIWSAFSY